MPSKGAERSQRSRAVTLPLSVEARIPFTILRVAVSVEWHHLLNCLTTIFSRTVKRMAIRRLVDS